jgi:hypothetical protein
MCAICIVAELFTAVQILYLGGIFIRKLQQSITEVLAHCFVVSCVEVVADLRVAKNAGKKEEAIVEEKVIIISYWVYKDSRVR